VPRKRRYRKRGSMNCILCNRGRLSIIADKLRNGEDRSVYYCGHCKLGMLDDDKDEAQLKKFYNGQYRKTFKPDLRKVSQAPEIFGIYSGFQGARIDLIKPYLTKKMRLLEIGCSAGMFLYHVKKYVKEVTGIDYDSASARFAGRKCSCKTYDCALDDTGLARGQFDVICMFQVLEHAGDPVELLENVKRYLKPHGFLYIEVPNLRDALIEAYDLPHHHDFYFHAAHRWYFTKDSLLSLMKRAGVKGKLLFTQDYNFLNHMHWAAVDAPQRSCVQGLSDPGLPLRRGLDKLKKKALDEYILCVDRGYKKLLSKLELTSNMAFIGRT